MNRRAFFTLQGAKRAAAPFFFDGWAAIGLLFVAALALTFALSGADAAAVGLFQSPQSPVEADPPPVEPQPEQPAPAEPQPEQPAPAEPQPQQPAPAEAAPAAGSEAQPAPADAGQPLAPAGEAPLPPPLPEPERPSRRNATPPGDGEPQMVLDQAEFIDTVVVSVAYVWLCCGIVLILVIPLIFLFLHIRGRSKIIKEERY